MNGVLMSTSDSEKGVPFTAVTETYLNVTEVRLNPNNNYVTFSENKVPDQFVSTRFKGTVAKKTKLKGSSTNLPKTHYLGALLLRNEILGCIAQATDKHFLIRNMRKEYPKWKMSAANTYLHSFSDKRKAYNTGTLYAKQSIPPLYCFYWNKEGYIHHPRLRSQLLSFQYCKRQLTQEQFADPRFFTPMELANIIDQQLKEHTDYINWHVPVPSEIQAIEAEIKKPIYDSIQFPSGFGKEHNPI